MQFGYECNSLIKLFTGYVLLSEHGKSINAVYQATLIDRLKEDSYGARYGENMQELMIIFQKYNLVLIDVVQRKIKPNEAASLLTQIITNCKVQSILDLHKHITSFLVEEKSS